MLSWLNRRVRNRTHGGVRGREIYLISLLLDYGNHCKGKLLYRLTVCFCVQRNIECGTQSEVYRTHRLVCCCLCFVICVPLFDFAVCTLLCILCSMHFAVCTLLFHGITAGCCPTCRMRIGPILRFYGFHLYRPGYRIRYSAA